MFKEDLINLNGYWEYSDGKYLALLASGKISDVFCNTGVLTTYPKYLRLWCKVLAGRLTCSIVNVIGPGMGGITLSYELAANISAAKSYFTEPYEELGVKNQKFRFDIPTDIPVILCEDVITTGGSVQKTLSAVWKEGLVILPVVVCLVDRRNEKGPISLKTADGDITANVVSLLEITPKTWDTIDEAKKVYPNVIEAIKPKANWNKLTGKV